jgi:large subunit ribosomal protein L10
MPSTKRLAKETQVDGFKESLNSAQAAILAQQSGITVEKITEFRAKLREQNIFFKVMKNTLAKRAIQDTSLEGLKDYLSGPNILAVTKDDPVGMAKALVEFAKQEKEKLVIKAGVLEGKLLDAKEVVALAAVPPREVLLARLAGSLQAPYAGLVYTLSGVLRKFVYALEAIRSQKEEQGK